MMGTLKNTPMRETTQENCLRNPLGCYCELTAGEFARKAHMTVVVYKHPSAVAEFAGFRRVLSVESCRELALLLSEEGPDQAVGLVCENGETSARMAIRISQEGWQVNHLVGGLGQWRVYHQTARAG